MTYKHFSIDERACIARYLEDDVSITRISELIGRHPSSVYREINRNADEHGKYSPAFAEIKAQKRQSKRKNHLKFSRSYKLTIEQGLINRWSPEQIVGHHRSNEKTFVCFKTVYRWIKSGKILNGDVSYLRRKGRTYKRRTDVNRMRGGKSIHDRPDVASTRSRLGDWEIDTVIGGKNTKTCVLTIVDRKSRFLKAALLPDRKADRVAHSIQKLMENEIVHTLTADNGKEFSAFKHIEKALNIDIFFADPYASWQRGTNENTNGLLREFIPKGQDIGNYTENQLEEFVSLINTRPRKVLDFRSAEDVYLTPS